MTLLVSLAETASLREVCAVGWSVAGELIAAMYHGLSAGLSWVRASHASSWLPRWPFAAPLVGGIQQNATGREVHTRMCRCCL
jgi:hypothetical protein